jgi:hypothetical protein
MHTHDLRLELKMNAHSFHVAMKLMGFKIFSNPAKSKGIFLVRIRVKETQKQYQQSPLSIKPNSPSLVLLVKSQRRDPTQQLLLSLLSHQVTKLQPKTSATTHFSPSTRNGGFNIWVTISLG